MVTLRHKRPSFLWILILAGVILVAGITVLIIPGTRLWIDVHFDQIRADIKYRLDPPQQVIFVPENQVAQAVQATLLALTPDPTPTSYPTPVPLTPLPSLTPTITPTPLPGSMKLVGVDFQSQRYMWNYCAPANLAMALSFWGWKGDKLDVGHWVKPYDKDKNVMPYELQNFTREVAGLDMVVRVNGDSDLIRRFIVAGYPVLIEKGEVLHGEYGPGSEGWMGHFMLFTGYDDSKKTFIVQDSLVGTDTDYSYDLLETDWRPFNHVFMVIFPPERQNEVYGLLGPLADEKTAFEQAALRASNEVYGLSDRDQFFAWFNRGSNLVELQDYGGAASAFDEAFAMYPSIPEDDRPYRAMWYNTAPYYAYYFTGRYWDVITLATTTLDAMAEPMLEESYYWRARAEFALGDTVGAEKDLRLALKYHKRFQPALDMLTEMGIQF
jgi:hypothetical protein